MAVERTWLRFARDANQEETQRFGLTKFDGYQLKLITDENVNFLAELMLFSLQRNQRCLEVGIDVCYTIICANWIHQQDMYELERETISALYNIFLDPKRYTPEPAEVRSFMAEIKRRSKIDVEDEAFHPAMRFINNCAEFMKEAIQLKAIPAGPEFDNFRTFVKLRISGYLLNVDKPTLFQSLINNMYETYLAKNDNIQAALSLQLLANTYNWDTTAYLPACEAPPFPAQSEFKRKEALYTLMARKFAKGNRLEQAVECYDELLDAYKDHNFDLSGLSFCHGELCKVFKSLETVGRIEPSYFMVHFLGFGFPTESRGKIYIFEGEAFEHITSVHHRIIRMYPGARLVKNEDEAKKLAANPTFGKHLFIKTVVPYKNKAETKQVSFMTQQYLDKKDLNTFVSTRRLPGSSNVTNLWTEETTYETELTFPALMNRSEVRDITVNKLSPIKNAIKSLLEKNGELSNLEFWIKRSLKEGIDPKTISGATHFNNLSRILAGTVDSPVNGGVGQYRVFLTAATYDDPEYEADVGYLKNCFNNLIRLLNNLLKLHQALVPANLKPQHEVMMELFVKNFKAEIDDLKLDTKSILKLDDMVESMIASKIRTRRQQRTYLGSQYGSTAEIQSSSGYSHPDSSTDV
ncbi:unnamed protein product [Ambrosiozyma monospora]|uniref:Unnamed protein product n=1 Tax=Ambrosiozyma monospora TaxID=43982 RepID=A0ACB5T742_AMBMO|nr:unnamed protein product [Ambrosiozyma monospora]